MQWQWTNLQKLDISFKKMPLLRRGAGILEGARERGLAEHRDEALASVLRRLPRLTHLAARCYEFGGLHVSGD